MNQLADCLLPWAVNKMLFAIDQSKSCEECKAALKTAQCNIDTIEADSMVADSFSHCTEGANKYGIEQICKYKKTIPWGFVHRIASCAIAFCGWYMWHCGMHNAVLRKATDAFRVNKYLSLHGQCNVLHFISITCSHHELCALCTVQCSLLITGSYFLKCNCISNRIKSLRNRNIYVCV